MKAPPRPTDEIEELRQLGEHIYGANWQSPMSKALGISTTLISLLMKRERALTDKHRRAIADMLERTIRGDQEAFAARQIVMHKAWVRLQSVLKD